MLSRKMRWPITYKLVAQPCRSYELQPNTMKSDAETSIFLFKKHPRFDCFCTSDGAMANLLNYHALEYPSTTGNNSVCRTAP